jgi:hypothetical protein
MLLESILSPEGAAVIFGGSCLLFGLLLVLDSKRKQGETQDYRLMQRVYGWILIIIPTLFILGGLYMKFTRNSELLDMSQTSLTNPFAGGLAGGFSVDYSDKRITERIKNLSYFNYILFKLGLRKLKKHDLPQGDLYH